LLECNIGADKGSSDILVRNRATKLGDSSTLELYFTGGTERRSWVLILPWEGIRNIGVFYKINMYVLLERKEIKGKLKMPFNYIYKITPCALNNAARFLPKLFYLKKLPPFSLMGFNLTTRKLKYPQ
jgi:hypothetical protein